MHEQIAWIKFSHFEEIIQKLNYSLLNASCIARCCGKDVDEWFSEIIYADDWFSKACFHETKHTHTRSNIPISTQATWHSKMNFRLKFLFARMLAQSKPAPKHEKVSERKESMLNICSAHSKRVDRRDMVWKHGWSLFFLNSVYVYANLGKTSCFSSWSKME